MEDSVVASPILGKLMKAKGLKERYEPTAPTNGALLESPDLETFDPNRVYKNGDKFLDIDGKSVVELSCGCPVNADHGEFTTPFTQEQAFDLAMELGIPQPIHVGFGMYVAIAVITPAMAQRWLEERNPSNRSPIMRGVEQLIHDIQGDTWWLTHQGFAFLSNGMLRDGQHRLASIVCAGKAILAFVVLNISEEAVAAIDSGRVRTPSDYRAIRGEASDASYDSIARRLLAGSHASFVGTNQEINRWIFANKGALEWVMDQFPTKSAKEIRGVRVAPVLAATCAAYLHLRPEGKFDRLAEFCSVLQTNRTNRPDEDRAAVMLREWLRSVMGGRFKATATPVHKMIVTEQCIKLFHAEKSPPKDLAKLSSLAEAYPLTKPVA